MSVLENTRAIGVSTIGDGTHQAVFHIKTIPVANKPSILAMDSVNASTGVRTTYYLWVDSSGYLRIHTSIPTTEVSDGDMVGEQGT